MSNIPSINILNEDKQMSGAEALNEQAVALVEQINNPVHGKALALRLASLLCSPAWGYQHGSIMNLGNAMVASKLVNKPLVSDLSINDSTPEGLVALEKILMTGPKDFRKAYVYDICHSDIQHTDDGFIAQQLVVFSFEFADYVDTLQPTGNSGRPRWVEGAHIAAEGKSGAFLPRLLVRGVDEASRREVNIREAFDMLQINADYRSLVLDKAAAGLEKKEAIANGTWVEPKKPNAVSEESLRTEPRLEESCASIPALPEIPRIKLGADDADFVMDTAAKLTETHSEFGEEEMNRYENGEYLQEVLNVGDIVVERHFSKNDTRLIFKSDELTARLKKLVAGLPEPLRMDVYTKITDQAFEHLNAEYTADSCVREVRIPKQHPSLPFDLTFCIHCTAIPGPHALETIEQTYQRSLVLAAVVIKVIKSFQG